MNAYIFVAAAFTSVIPLLVILKSYINKIVEDPTQALKVQRKFFINVALSKILPVVLLIFGIIKITYVEDISNLYMPWLIILVLVIIGLVYIKTQKKVTVDDDDAQFAINSLLVIAQPLLFSIPIMAAAFIFLMTQ